MKLHFDANQDFQLEAVKSVVDLFQGNPLNKGDFEYSVGGEAEGSVINEYGVGNRLFLDEKTIQNNLAVVQSRNNLLKVPSFAGMHFSVEMETGTGKTYVYLRTIYELNKIYGFKKFIIVVPSVAIKEGVNKNLEITKEHFQNLYNNVPVNYKVYDSGRIAELRNFALSNNIEILVINIDSFAKDTNIINQARDSALGKKPIEFIQSTSPIVIIDEPQNMETDIRKKAIENLHPLCTLRYSATHTNLYNPVYNLNPVKAYDLGLVKQIEVDSIFAEDGFNQAYISLEGLKPAKKSISARIRIDVNTDKGVTKKAFNVKSGADLYELSNEREIYKEGYKIISIDVSNGCIELSNGNVIHKGETQGGLQDEVMKVQVGKAVKEHFHKQKKYKEKGIKVLTLFFIDRVANYRSYDDLGKEVPGKFALWFEEIYKKYAKASEFKKVMPFEAGKVHNGYFAQDKKGKFKDSASGETQADDDTYKLIMQKKEELLDIKNPLSFIFSHSALREGWDNPNVFQICTLNETRSDLKKRQEIGRGLRLSVNQQGDRIRDKNINILTVIANESYEDFAKKLQNEIHEDCGVEFTGRIKNARNKQNVKFRKGFELDKNFIDLWNKIKQKTTYRVDYKTDELIKDAGKAIKDMPAITKTVIRAEKVRISMLNEGVKTNLTGTDLPETIEMKVEIPDILGYIQSKTELTRSTILQIIKESGRIADIMDNPQMFLDFSVEKLKAILTGLLIEGIKYEKIAGQEWAMMLFESKDIECYVDNLYAVNNCDKTIASHIIIDSMSEPERKFAEECDSNQNIEFFIKLPRWFVIKTPIGPYTPDWALIFKDDKKLYFVAETKSTLGSAGLRMSEIQKVKCGARHFEQFPEVTYKQVTKVTDLLNLK